MSMKQSVALKLGQSLTMTPALRQAIRMLQLSTLDLRTEIQDALDSNLMLDTEEGDTAPAAEEPVTQEPERSSDEIPENLPVDANWDDVYGEPPPRTPTADEEAVWEYRQANMHVAPDLHQHLNWQAEVTGFTERQAEIAAHIIDAVDANGYLREWDELCERLCAELGVEADVAQAVLKNVQDFDPPGVAARNLAECLTIQLQQLPGDTDGRATALTIVAADGLEALAANDHCKLARLAGGVAQAELDAAVSLIRALQPYPGEAFGEGEAEYIVPEVFVARVEGRWQVSLNAEIAPRLRINPEYQALIKRADKSADQSTLKEHLQEARFFLNSLRSRNETLLRVAQSIVEVQRAFLEYGEEAMKPLVLRDVADELEVHESTVSRATANKYMQTPRGLFELKYFFSSHVATADGGTCSATAIQAIIRRLVAGEPAGKPYSDSRLAELLLKEGIRVARRTIAKYREALGIAPSHQRRRSHG